MIRKIAAVVIGTILAIVLIIVVESLSHVVYPPPTDIDMDDEEALKGYFSSVPAGALLFVAAAWMIGTFAGGMLATFIARESAVINCTIIGGLVLTGTVMNLISIPHPTWFAIASILAIIATTVVTSKVAASFVGKYSDGPGEQTAS